MIELGKDGWNAPALALAVLSAVDLSDHDRAVYEEGREDAYEQGYENGAADALRKAADDLIEAFPQTFRGEDGYLSARMYSSGEYAEWLRARAEAVTDD